MKRKVKRKEKKRREEKRREEKRREEKRSTASKVYLCVDREEEEEEANTVGLHA